METTESKPASPPILGRSVSVQRTWSAGGDAIPYRAVADWIVLRERDEPIASMFYTAYFAEGCDPAERPITFVFNGGPGASSVYLHLGLVGPRCVSFTEHGDVLPPPTRIVDNPDSWLRFTDLVCIDPIGTGFSRSHEPQEDPKKPKPSRFWEVERDLTSVAELITRLLTKEKRWSSKVILAGESYGGYRVARLAKLLPETAGVALTAAILISPGTELSGLLGSDYNLEHWVELFPGLAATAKVHGRAGEGRTATAHRELAEAFATDDWVRFLVQGDGMPLAERQRICAIASELIGIPASVLLAANGRLTREVFCRMLLQDQQRFVGRYDGSVSNLDPYPDRPTYEGPDNTLDGLTPTFASGINQVLREDLGLETELQYQQINMEANEAWTDSKQEHYIAVVGPSLDALRFGMAMNPALKVVISHGHFDLVTPYFGATRLVRQMKLTSEQQVHQRHFDGGHMFYSHLAARTAFTDWVQGLLATDAG